MDVTDHAGLPITFRAAVEISVHVPSVRGAIRSVLPVAHGPCSSYQKMVTACLYPGFWYTLCSAWSRAKLMGNLRRWFTSI